MGIVSIPKNLKINKFLFIGVEMIELDMIGLEMIGLEMIGLEMTGLDMIGLEIIGLEMIGSRYIFSSLEFLFLFYNKSYCLLCIYVFITLPIKYINNIFIIQ